MRRRVRVFVAYDGSQFYGWQFQPGLRTVQGELTRAVREGLPRRPGSESEGDSDQYDVVGASRTDTGVHAYGQAAAFTTDTPLPTEKIPCVLNAELARDVRILEAEEVSEEFDPRRDACGKLYRYSYSMSPVDDPFSGCFSTWIREEPDVDAMRAAAAWLIGEHDFASFKNTSDLDRESTVRRLDHVGVRRDGALLHVEVVGTAFLYRMVRNIAGTLLDVGRGRFSPDDVRGIVAARDRAAAGTTAPPEGLCLVRVFFAPAELVKAAFDPSSIAEFLRPQGVPTTREAPRRF